MKKAQEGGPESDMNVCDKLTERHLAVVQQGLSTILNTTIWTRQKAYSHFYKSWSLSTNYQCDNYVLQWWVEFIDELSWLFTKRFRAFYLICSQILLKISVIPILLTFIYLVALNLLVNNQLNSSSNSTHHFGT